MHEPRHYRLLRDRRDRRAGIAAVSEQPQISDKAIQASAGRIWNGFWPHGIAYAGERMSGSQNSSLTPKMKRYFFRASAEDFRKIPGSPVAYWPSQQLRSSFSNHKSLSDIAKPRQGLATTDNDRFLKFWFECSQRDTAFPASSLAVTKWYPCQKGGGFRKWFGNNDYVVNWKNRGEEIKKLVEARYGSASKRVVNEHLYFKEGITWSSLSSAALSMRYVPPGFIFETKGSMCFFEQEENLMHSLGFCNSSIVNPLLQCVSPTLDYHEGPVGTLPISGKVDDRVLLN